MRGGGKSTLAAAYAERHHSRICNRRRDTAPGMGVRGDEPPHSAAPCRRFSRSEDLGNGREPATYSMPA
jgi:hypothetical protein